MDGRLIGSALALALTFGGGCVDALAPRPRARVRAADERDRWEPPC